MTRPTDPNATLRQRMPMRRFASPDGRELEGSNKASGMATTRHVISLGYCCSPASELERIGLRRCSYPFDWLIIPFPGAVDLVENGFRDILSYELMAQHRCARERYCNRRHNAHFIHDFDAYRPLADQLDEVAAKYRRRIERFYSDIAAPTVFLKYVRDQEECAAIERDLPRIERVLRLGGGGNEIVFAANDGVVSEAFPIHHVAPDPGDIVARRFLEKNAALERFLIEASGLSDAERSANVESSRRVKPAPLARSASRLRRYLMRKLVREHVHSEVV